MRLVLILFYLLSTNIFSQEKLISKYTNFDNDCVSDPSIQEGDVPRICKGVGGYQIYITYSACSEFISIQDKTKKTILNLPEQNFSSSDNKKLEWRIFKGKVVGIIFRVSLFVESDVEPCGRKKTGEELIIRGLGDYSKLNKSVSGKNENEKARNILDKFVLTKE